MANNEEQTFAIVVILQHPIPEDVEEAFCLMQKNGITTLVHDMKVNGFHLVETKQKINVNPNMTITVHSRSIDDRSYDVQETLTEGMDEPDRVIETEMTQEEVETFEEDWRNLWNPQVRNGRRVHHINYYI